MKGQVPLYVLRHGETEWNREGRIQGARDSALTARGRAQAAAMGRALSAELARNPGPTSFVRSPLGRARETSLIVGQVLGVDPSCWRDDERLAEFCYGDWEGLTWPEIEARRPGAYADWRADPEVFTAPAGEAHLALHRRSARALSDITRSAMSTVIVCHGVSGAVLRGIYLGLDARAGLALGKPQDAFFRLCGGSEVSIGAAV
jgi:probable phosphoglycerate mutase